MTDAAVGAGGRGGRAGTTGSAGTAGRPAPAEDAGASDAAITNGSKEDAATGSGADAASPAPTDGGSSSLDAAPAADTGPTVDPRSPVLPIVVLDVPSLGTDPKKLGLFPMDARVTGSMKVYLGHTGMGSADQLKAALDKLSPVQQTRVGLKGRGKVSSYPDFPKRPFSLEFQDDAGADRALPFVGLPSDADWVFHSCWADVTCMRNALVYTLARDPAVGRYGVRSQHVEVFINGQYWGMYLVVEKIERDKDRVDLPKPAASAAEGDLSGGYIIRNEFTGNGRPTDKPAQDWLSRSLPLIYSYSYPKPENITEAQRKYVMDAFAALDTLATKPQAEFSAGYEQIIDVASWVDFAIFQELTNNCDAYMKSVYMRKLPTAQGGKIAMGPLWDFDFALANVDFRDAQLTTNWAFKMDRFAAEGVQDYTKTPIPFLPAYWKKVWADTAFTNKVKCRYRDLRKTALADGNVAGIIDGFEKRLALAEPRDHKRWPTINAPMCCGIKAFPTYKGYVDYMRKWLTERLAFMDKNLPGTCQ